MPPLWEVNHEPPTNSSKAERNGIADATLKPLVVHHRCYLSLEFCLHRRNAGNQTGMFSNQHYIPQFRSFTTAIDKVASEYGFYNIGGSAQLDDVIWKFEAATAPIVEEIRARKSLAGIDEHKRIWLAGFTALQYVRTRAFSERSQDMMRQITHVVTQMSGGKLSKQIRKQLGLDAAGSEHEKTLSTILGLVRPAVDELRKKHLVLFRSDESSLFWIGMAAQFLTKVSNAPLVEA